MLHDVSTPSCLAPSRLSPLASRPSRLLPLASRPSRLSPLASRPSRHCPRCRYGRSAAAPLHVVVPRSTCNVQPSTPRTASPRAAAPLRPSTLSSHVQPATFNLQPRAPPPSPHPLAPRPPNLSTTFSQHPHGTLRYEESIPPNSAISDSVDVDRNDARVG